VTPPVRNALSIDLEDWFQPFVRRALSGWEQYGSRVPQETERLLAVLGEHGVRCTFFVLGELAERFPDVIRSIHGAGHEIGSHGYRHVPLFTLEPAQFEAEMRPSLDYLAQLTGEAVQGFRAPYFSLRAESLWAIESLHRLGLKYDSSINPTAKVLHGYRQGGRLPYHHPNGLKEYPVTTYPVLGLPMPFGGSLYYRLLPYPVIRAGLRRLSRRNIAANLYFHPRDFDPDLPRLETSLALKLIMYVGTSTLEAKLERLLQDFRFVPLREL